MRYGSLMLALLVVQFVQPLALAAEPFEVGSTMDPLPQEGWIGGTPVNLEPDHYYMLYGWASWCSPCVIYFERTIEWCEQQQNVDITMIAISGGRTLGNDERECSRQESFLKERNLTLPAICNASMTEAFGLGADYEIPFYVLIDSNRQVLASGHPNDLPDRSEVNQLSEWSTKSALLFEQLKAARKFQDRELESNLLRRIAEVDATFVRYGAMRIELLSQSHDSAAAMEYANELFDRYGYQQEVVAAVQRSIIGKMSRKSLADAIEALESLAARGGEFTRFGITSYSLQCQFADPDQDSIRENGNQILQKVLRNRELLLELTRTASECGLSDSTLLAACIDSLAKEDTPSIPIDLLVGVARAAFKANDFEAAVKYQEMAIANNTDSTGTKDLESMLTYYEAKRDVQKD